MVAKARALRKVFVPLLVAWWAAAQVLPAFAEEVHRFDVVKTDAAGAIQEFGVQSGVQILAAGEGLTGKRLNTVAGDLSTEEGLRRLLAGTGLTHRYVGQRAVALVSADQAAPSSSPQSRRDSIKLAAESPTPASAPPPGHGSTQHADGAPVSSPTASAAGPIEEIVVTATKREVPVRRISGSVSAFNETGLEALGAVGFADYLTRTPGVVFNQSVPGNSSASIRGVATTTGIAQAQGTTGYFINDVPLTDPFYSGGIPDIDTFDVDNITVLRGPQGTLFGSASMGGAINYQAAKPDLSRFDAHVRASVESTQDGDTSYSGKVMLNAPIATDVFAVRGVFDYRQDGGYVDNIGTGQDDANETEVRGGRLLATLAPAPGTTINYLFLQQTQDTVDAGFVEPAIGPYAKSTALAEQFSYRTRIHNLRLDQEFSFATLTATAARHEKKFSGTQDFSSLLPPALGPAAFLEPGTSEGDTFEVRLASPSGRRFEYLIGAFYDSTDEEIINQLVAPNAAPVLGDATLLDATVLIEGEESALFGEFTWHFTDRLKASLGGRYFETRLSTNISQSGPLVGGSTSDSGESRENGFSPKVSLTWTAGDDLLIYGLVSKGFRFGGPNIAVDPDFAIPGEFDSDSLINYELGVRATLLDRRLQLDGTVFYVDWSDIQVTLRTPGGFTYTDNAGEARNYGIEGTATFRPSRRLALQGNVTYLDASLRSDFISGAAVVPAGTTLPGASEWQISDSAIYTFIDSAFVPTLAFSHRYVSTAPGALVPSPQQQGGYNLFDLRLSAQFGGMGLAAFIENIDDERGITQAVTSNRGPSEYIVRPRTYGLTLDYRF